MSKNAVRLAIAFAALGLIAVAALTAAENTLAGRFTATTSGIDIGTGEAGKSDTLRVDVLRWSTDAERDQLLSAFMKSEKDFVDALAKQTSAGYVWTSGSVGFTLRYAYRLPLAGGGDRIILATDRRLNSGGPGPWTAASASGGHDFPFTLIELRIAKGVGEGRMSLAGTVGVDADAKTVALDGYANAPVLLKNVKREP
jgi:hypothetical protein